MTPEEINNTIEFLIKNAATFSVHMDELRIRMDEFRLRQEQDEKFLMSFAKSTAQFQSWAAELVAIESRRLDEHDRLHRDALRLLNSIMDRLPPLQH